MRAGGIDPTIVQIRLHEIQLLLDDLGSLGDIDGERLRQDRFTRHVTERVLSQIVDLATSINTHIAAAVLAGAVATAQARRQQRVPVG